ncbi:MAG: hypothetical protein PHV34_09615 [Verrucomicrobiae bacterium]|nr:hypothetical protein [Verrucomicrobiae bacterium]
MVENLDFQDLAKPVHAWHEIRKGTSRCYAFARLGDRKISLGSDPHASDQFLRLIRAEKIKRFGAEFCDSGKLRERGSSSRPSKISELQKTALIPSGRYLDGNSVRFVRKKSLEESWRREFRGFSRMLLEQMTWTGISEDDWVRVRRELQSQVKRRARLGIPLFESEANNRQPREYLCN